MHWDKTRLWILNIFKSLTASLLVAIFLVSCGGKEPVDPTPTPGPGPDPKPPVETKDTKAPTITVKITEKNVIAGVTISIKDNQLLFDQDVAATWSDDVSKSCKVELTLTPDGSSSKAINSGDKLSEAGKLGIKVTDEAGNSSSAEIKLTRVDNGAPQISLAISEKNVVAGVAVTINDNRLLFNDQVAASWTDDYSTTLTTVLTLAPEGGQSKTLNSGDILYDAGKLTLSVADEANNKATAEITLTAIAITGLENLQYLSLQVDHMVNLLEGVTITEGLTLEKVEVEQDGIKSVIPDAKTYTPEVPGLINIILTLGRSDGTTIEVRVDGLTVKGLDYTAPKMKTADIIQERYPWYNNLQQSTRDFIYPHLLASYAASNYSKQENWIHIIMGENTDAPDVEHIGQFYDPSSHAYSGYFRFRAINPDTPIIDCNDYWSGLDSYLDQHPDKFYTIGEASSGLGGSSLEMLLWWIDYQPQKKVLENQNVIVLVSGGNWIPNWKIYNEDEIDGNRYQSCSTNSKYYNKITVKGYSIWWPNNFFSPENPSIYGWLNNSLPVWYYLERWNILMPMIPLIYTDYTEDGRTTCSFPTSVCSAVVWNAVSIVLSNHPGITPVDAMTIIVNNYFKEEKFQYKDETTNWELVDGGSWYFINIQKLMENEILQADKQPPLCSNCGLVNLPDGPGIYYEGPGVLFTVDGSTYDMTEENRAVFESAIQSGKEIKWSYNSDRAKKYGVSSIKAGVMDKSARLIPDLSLTIQVN